MLRDRLVYVLLVLFALIGIWAWLARIGACQELLEWSFWRCAAITMSLGR